MCEYVENHTPICIICLVIKYLNDFLIYSTIMLNRCSNISTEVPGLKYHKVVNTPLMHTGISSEGNWTGTYFKNIILTYMIVVTLGLCNTTSKFLVFDCALNGP